VPGGAPKPYVLWRHVLTDLWGIPIAMYTGIANDVEFKFLLNRPASLTFTVPSEHKLVNIVHTDGDPYLSVGNRLIKSYRKVSHTVDEQPATVTPWELQFVGRIWQIADSGDEDTVNTAVTCFDPLQDCSARVVRMASGNFQAQVKWWSTKGDTIIKEMIDRTNACSLAPLLFTTTGGTFTDTDVQTVAYDQKMILPSIIELTDTGTVDITMTYNDYQDDTKTDWTGHATISATPRMGSDKPDVIFGYAAPPRTVKTYDRTQDMNTFANDVTLWGKTAKGHTANASDSDSIAKYGAFEEAAMLSGVETLELVEMLTDEQLALRKAPKDVISIVPLPGVSMQPFNEWFLGDTVTVNVGRTPFPVTRTTADGVQRIYGFTLGIDPDIGEQVTELVVSAQAEGS